MELVQYEVRDRIADVTIANGKANALVAGGHRRARRGADARRGRRPETRSARVLVTGAPGMLSGGFDLKVMRSVPEPRRASS